MSKIKELNLKIGGMHCAGCVANIENGMTKSEGILECQVNLALHSAVVKYDSEKLDQKYVINQIVTLGYKAEPGKADILTANQNEVAGAKADFITSVGFAAPLMVLAMWPMISGDFLISSMVDSITQAVFAGITLFWAGRSILSDAFKQTIHFRANMNSLIAMGSLAAFGWSLFALIKANGSPSMEMLYFESAGMIIALILLGRFLESRSRSKAGEAIKALSRLRPKKTTAVINGIEIEIDAATAQKGMILLVRPGERIPADGKVVEGKPVVDESLMTGESLPVEKSEGAELIGGALNGNVAFKMEVTRTGENSFLNSVIRLVSEAQSRKAPIQSTADRVAGIFVPVVLGIAILTLIGWYVFAPDSPMLIKSVVSVLIIACPCALGLATPTAVLVGTGRSATEGIIIRGGDVLEHLSTADTILFDKTGTITHGRLDVVTVKTFGKLSERNLIRIVGSAESRSEHPVAKAVTRYMKLQEIETTMVRDVTAMPGFGLKAECDGHPIIIGSRSMMEQEGISFGQSLMFGEKEMSQGRTVIFAAMDGHVVGAMSLSDQLRGEATEVIAKLKSMGKKIMMLSGDNRKTAEGVANLVGLDSFQAEIKPDQKKYIVETYRKSGFNVIMVGDGINDAPALAMATVGVAIGSGSDVAIEAADVVLVRSDLNAIVTMIEISTQTIRVIRQNLFWAFAYNVAAIPIAAGLFYPLFGWTLSPMIAAGAMAFSSLFVVTNSLRLSRNRN